MVFILFEFCSIPVLIEPQTHFDIDFSGTVFITDARGTGQNIAFSMANMGLYVLAGVPTESDVQNFTFDKRKGIEPILFDMKQPNDVVEVLYRIRELIRDLKRPLTALIINTLENDDHSFTGQSNSGDASEPHFVGGLDINFDLSLEQYQSIFKNVVKPFIRIIDATLQIWQEPAPHRGHILVLSSDEGDRTKYDERMHAVAKTTIRTYLDELRKSLLHRNIGVTVNRIFMHCERENEMDRIIGSMKRKA
jgi:hypothetical protein